MKNAFAFAILMTGFLLAAPAAEPAGNEPPSEGVQLSIDQMLSIAEKQHEIARLLIKEGQFDRVLPEMRKILELNLQGEYEQAVAKSAGFIAYLLTENKQYSIGHELLDETLARMRLTQNVASLLKIKAYIYKTEGKLGKAIETLERSVEIERQQTQP
jgi:tetratricopeptide (TPR) repeat protein